jgi:anti-sigma B factor antagonist
MPFDVTIVNLHGSVELAVSGEIDLSVSDRLWAAIEHVISPDRPLVLDMHRVTFFDVSGLRVLLQALERLDHDPTKLVLRSPSAIVMRVLLVTNTDQLMTITDVRDDVRRTKHRIS